MSKHNNESFLKCFNKEIDNVLNEIKNDKYICDAQFYSFISDLINMICSNMSYQNELSIKELSLIQKDEMFDVILQFFKSINIELFNKAKKILDNTYPNIKTYIYDFHKDDLNKTTFYSVLYGENNIKVFLPLRYYLDKSKLKEFIERNGENVCTIDDLYSSTHEISHLFDINLENYSFNYSKTRDMLCETTPIVFELFLSEYLLKNKIFDENIIKSKNIQENNKLYTHANLCRIKMDFLELKNKKGIITEEDIEIKMNNDLLNNDEYIKIINLIVNSDITFAESKRYAISGMYAPIIFQKCKIVSNQNLLQQYLDECSQNIPFTDILYKFGIDLKKEIKFFKKEDDRNR